MRALGLALALVLGSACVVSANPAPTAPAPAAPSASASVAPSPTAPPSPSGARPAPKGRLESHTFVSTVLSTVPGRGRTMPYLAYLPPGYDRNPNARYPVVFLLHGGGGTNTEWADYGLVDAADRLMGSGAIAPLIVVLPQGDQEYWVDHVVDRAVGANGEPWGTYTAREVVAEIDRRFRTIARPAGRAIGGLSMGAHGALQLSLNFPGVWSVVGAHSPALRPFGDAPTFLGAGAEFAARDPFALMQSKVGVARTLEYWIDNAESDPWFTRSAALHAELLALGIAHEWHASPGGHDAAYWGGHLEEYLRYYAGALCRERAACPSGP